MTNMNKEFEMPYFMWFLRQACSELSDEEFLERLKNRPSPNSEEFKQIKKELDENRDI